MKLVEYLFNLQLLRTVFYDGTSPITSFMLSLFSIVLLITGQSMAEPLLFVNLHITLRYLAYIINYLDDEKQGKS